MAVYFDNAGVHALWSLTSDNGFLVLYAEIAEPRVLYPEFFTSFIGMNELQDGVEVPPEGLLVF